MIPDSEIIVNTPLAHICVFLRNRMRKGRDILQDITPNFKRINYGKNAAIRC